MSGSKLFSPPVVPPAAMTTPAGTVRCGQTEASEKQSGHDKQRQLRARGAPRHTENGPVCPHTGRRVQCAHERLTTARSLRPDRARVRPRASAPGVVCTNVQPGSCVCRRPYSSRESVHLCADLVLRPRSAASGSYQGSPCGPRRGAAASAALEYQRRAVSPDLHVTAPTQWAPRTSICFASFSPFSFAVPPCARVRACVRVCERESGAWSFKSADLVHTAFANCSLRRKSDGSWGYVGGADASSP